MIRNTKGVKTSSYDRVVIGGGLFGAYAASVLGKAGYKVLLIEKDAELMSRASYINQARLHTGLHYPRSLITAQESLKYYELFRKKFHSAVHDFEQIYAISSRNSKTSGEEFLKFILRLGIDFEEVDHRGHFKAGTVDLAVKVEEPTFDARVLRQIILSEINSIKNIEVKLNATVIDGEIREFDSSLELDTEETILTEGVVIATYAGINSLRNKLGLDLLPLHFELTEIVLGKVHQSFTNLGITMMDGPFWSVMPFGNSDLVSLTSVGITPIYSSKDFPTFPCQDSRIGCSSMDLANCSNCHVRPKTTAKHQLQQMKMFMKDEDFFSPTETLVTVKSILSTTLVDDARPTLIQREKNSKVWTVLSGKVSTLFDLEEALV